MRGMKAITVTMLQQIGTKLDTKGHNLDKTLQILYEVTELIHIFVHS